MYILVRKVPNSVLLKNHTHVSVEDGSPEKGADHQKHKKEKKPIDPPMGVAQLPREWAEASIIASNKKRAKELDKVSA